MQLNQEIAVEIKNVSKQFLKNGVPEIIIKDFNLTIPKNIIVSLFGPNACGKTTLLNLISGIYKPNSGKIYIHGENPKIGYMFQNYQETLMPWQTVFNNIAFPLELSGTPLPERRKAVLSILENMSVTLPLDMFPYQLSGGQKQLVCVARTLLYNANLLLLDEPFTALDFETRIKQQKVLADYLHRKPVTTILVSHDIDEAIFLADVVLVFAPRPLRIIHKEHINFLRPRGYDLFETTEFSKIRERIAHAFRLVIEGKVDKTGMQNEIIFACEESKC